jgi:DNA-binding NtrC family response regulator
MFEEISSRSATFRGRHFSKRSLLPAQCFPLEMPPLRERKEDIPLLVEYFVDRYASKAGKKIRNVTKKTLICWSRTRGRVTFESFQNVIERSVIVCETETLSVDERWLSRASVPTAPTSPPLSEPSVTDEKQVIEDALAESRGRYRDRRVRQPSSACRPRLWNQRSDR